MALSRQFLCVDFSEAARLPQLPWSLYAMLLAPLALILFATAYKSLQVRAAADWPSAPGKIVVSNSQVRNVRVLDDKREDDFRLEPRNFANIVYEYTVSGATLSNNRVSIGEDRGDFEVAETIARYPVGTAVTVYYNSLHPRTAVLERDLPLGKLWRYVTIGTAATILFGFGAIVGLNQLTEFIAARLAHPKMSPPSVVFAVFGLVLALFALALQKQAKLARQWPVVPGTIEMSGIGKYRAAPTKSGMRGPVMYQRRVSFLYSFDNVAYSCVQASLATGIYSTSGWLVGKFGTAYQQGAGVNVFVNPANPSEATLDPRAGLWICLVLWLAALAFAAGAYGIAHMG
jgi:Protein of unknown function (DUF3592)